MAMPPGSGDRMLADEAAELSSSSISSAPNSPHTIQVARPQFSNSATSGGGVVPASSATSVLPPASHTSAHGIPPTSQTAAQSTPPVPDKPKRQRRKKELGPDGKPVESDKPKQTRKPRTPKDSTANGTAPPRKKLKSDPDGPHARQATLTELAGGFHAPPSAVHDGLPQGPSIGTVDSTVRPNSTPLLAANSTGRRPYSSGQNYDPVRSANVEPAPTRPAQTPAGLSSTQASPRVNHASASPSIASLIDPPVFSKTSATLNLSPRTSSPHNLAQSRTQPPTPTPTHLQINAFAPPPLPISASPRARSPQPLDGTMDVDEPASRPKPQQLQRSEKTTEVKMPASKSSSSAATPQPVKPTPPVATKATGSGLLSSSNLFGGPASTETTERRGVNIDIQIKLDPRGNNTVNIAQEIMKKYGRDAINPRGAAHRERLLQIEAAANKLDGESGDGMSVDLSELDNDSNIEMGGMDDTEKPVKRRKKAEEYDKEDDFIDDTELAWQEQAAVAKDGFFVYSGPLVPVGEAANVESNAPAKPGRGRGRGRRAGAAAAGTTHAAFAKEKEVKEVKDAGAGAATATGRGRAKAARGTTTTRKPRIKKADREFEELQKKERERAGAALSVPNAGVSSGVAAMTGQTTYVLNGMSGSA